MDYTVLISQSNYSKYGPYTTKLNKCLNVAVFTQYTPKQIREITKDISPSVLIEGIAQSFASPSSVGPVAHLGPFDESGKLMNDGAT